MIAALRGRLLAVDLGEVVVDVGGVGYHVHITPGAAPGGLGDEVVLHTYLAVREDALTLYGFKTPAARELFTTLLAVSGFGPKLALATLGTLGEEGLRRAVIHEDVGALTVVPGVGKKGAARMILELRERLGALDAGEQAQPAAGAATDARAEVREALAGLGYAPAEVGAALDVVDVDAESDAEALLRATLRALARG